MISRLTSDAAHALVAHRDAVADRDRDELEREAAGVAHALLGPLGQPVERDVARGDLVPARRDTDLGLAPVAVGHPDRSQHGPGRGPLHPVGHLMAARLHVFGHGREVTPAPRPAPRRLPSAGRSALPSGHGRSRNRLRSVPGAIDRAGPRARRRAAGHATVAATEAWTVHDVVAHQVGVVTDVNAGNLDGIGTDALDRGPGRGAPRASRSPRPDRRVGAGRAAVRGDASPRSAGRRPRSRSPTSGTTSRTCGARSAIEGGRDLVAEQLAIEGYCAVHAPASSPRPGCAPLRLRAGVDEWVVRRGRARRRRSSPSRTSSPGSICGRRTAEQMRAYLWDGDPEPYVALLAATNLAEPLPT